MNKKSIGRRAFSMEVVESASRAQSNINYGNNGNNDRNNSEGK